MPSDWGCPPRHARPWDWPADVNWHESKAFAAYKSEQDNTAYRLITEAEHHCLRETNNPDDPLDIANDPVMLYSGTATSTIIS